jgi:hypothetical protein
MSGMSGRDLQHLDECTCMHAFHALLVR